MVQNEQYTTAWYLLSKSVWYLLLHSCVLTVMHMPRLLSVFFLCLTTDCLHIIKTAHLREGFKCGTGIYSYHFKTCDTNESF